MMATITMFVMIITAIVIVLIWRLSSHSIHAPGASKSTRTETGKSTDYSTVASEYRRVKSACSPSPGVIK